MINSRALHTIQVTVDWAPWRHHSVSTVWFQKTWTVHDNERSMRDILASILSVPSIHIYYNAVAFNTANAKPM